MNMDSNPSKEQLRTLIAQCDDRAAHHVLWVEKNGDVHVSPVPEELTPVGFQQNRPEMQLRLETFQRGNEYVGREAAADDDWVERLFASLQEQWPRAKQKKTLEYVDLF